MPRSRFARSGLVPVTGLLLGGALLLGACSSNGQNVSSAGSTSTTAAAGAASDAGGSGGTAAGGKTASASSATVKTADSALGKILVDGQGRTLYGFTKDTNGQSSCTGGCAEAWPPVEVDGGQLPAGLDPKVFTVIDRPDGTKQLKAGKWPLYRYAGDDKPGDTAGQGSGGSWFVVDPQGNLHKTGASSGSSAGGGSTTTKAPMSSSTSSGGYGY